MKKIIILAGLLAYSLSGFAGGDKGNGGLSVVCRNTSGAIISAELLDIYEGRIIYQRDYSNLQGTVESFISAAQEKLRNTPIYLKRVNLELEKIQRNLIFVPYGNELEEIDDALPVIRKKGCEFEQLANYTHSGLVLVSEEIYAHLDSLNRAALMIHESIYAIRRARGDVNSQAARELTAHLMALDGNTAVINKLIKGTNKTLCGLSGTVLDRLSDCASIGDEMHPNYVLVSRNKNLDEFYLESKTGVIWGPKLPANVTYFEAINRCENEFREFDLRWDLPTKADFLRAEKNQFRSEVLSNDADFYWINNGPMTNSYIYFKAEDGKISKGNKTFQLNVRCVSRIN